jgi:hypothetical protein
MPLRYVELCEFGGENDITKPTHVPARLAPAMRRNLWKWWWNNWKELKIVGGGHGRKVVRTSLRIGSLRLGQHIYRHVGWQLSLLSLPTRAVSGL